MKFRIVAAIVLVIVLFGCYVVALNSSHQETPASQSSDDQGSSGGFGSSK